MALYGTVWCCLVGSAMLGFARLCSGAARRGAARRGVILCGVVRMRVRMYERAHARDLI